MMDMLVLTWQEVGGWFFVRREVFGLMAYTMMAIGFLQSVIYTIQLPLAYLELSIQKYREIRTQSWHLITADITIPISILVPAYNEEVTVVQNVLSMLALKYPEFEVIVVNDGSKDDTIGVLKREFSLKDLHRPYEVVAPHQPIRGIFTAPSYPNLVVIDKENGGKADAINAGLNVARYSLFCTVDADSLLEADALVKAVQPFIDKPKTMIAVGGTVRIANGCVVHHGKVEKIRVPRNILARFQVVEYIRAFLIGRLAWSRVGILTIISGAFGVFKRSVALEVGGYSVDAIGEDLDLVLKMHQLMHRQKRPYDIQFIPEPVCWTEVPETLTILRKQRLRWQRGALQGFFRYAGMTMNPRYGRVGIFAFPIIFLLDILGPLNEFLGYILMPIFFALGTIEKEVFLAFLAIYFSLGIFISVFSLILEELSLRRFPRASDLLVLAYMAILENFGYRQLNNFWRVKSLFLFLLGRKQEWGQMTRKGFGKK
jgi:cellulose synthase/poly-beta-1,6-N-acetylglucosamine synthase-like glycosyltransferase